MPVFNEPSWGKVAYDFGISGACLLALAAMRYKAYFDRRKALYDTRRIYDPDAFLSEFNEENIAVEDEDEPTPEERTAPLAAAGAPKNAGRLLRGGLIIGALVGFFFGFRAYRAVTNFEDGHRLYRSHDFARAVEAYREALAADVETPGVRYRLGFALAALGNNTEAISQYRRALEMDPNYVSAHIDLGNALQVAGNLDEAILQYRKAIALVPSSDIAYLDLGNALARQGHMEEAIAAYKRSIQLAPANALIHVNLCNTLLAAGRTDQAIAEGRQATTLAPNSVITHTNLGNALFARERWEEAIAEFRRTTELKPDFAYGYFNLGSALMKNGQREQAIAAFETYLHMAENQPEYGEGIHKARENLSQLQSNP